ncbi:DNA-binding SARP family transcriptional activator/Tfp pilus assembly protein PilF [Spinactinospora alkalitolerans]|uniref:DNA-binding SARP family transcriptional activator/Tfp pilus assembly protein PilF n=1 Tax=Spinactinospora alkalitolerans TaxID=687207 RepID=A0A852U9X7_9ACTN|nr:tetratricopeptide repeat protein [Spinactinospora alkalitolerans]NYE50914.1 DNA-binding SARP family transcriptional activator/Tfp pilus assembly protein PilF [Spinactinospora alkalitolerans]
MSVGGPRQRCVLGALLVELGKEVTVERLVDFLWQDDPPRTARSIIQVQVSHLRQNFPDLIQTTAGGYLARTDPDRVDLHRFRGLAARAQEAEDPAATVGLWDEALSCWRGQPFSGTGSDYLYYTVCQPLLEERWAAVTAWAEAAFGLGGYAELAARLTPLVREDPLRERLHFLLIAALYRDGQRATALSVFHEIRKALAEQLGIDPGREVLELYERMLHDSEGPTRPPVAGPDGIGAGDAPADSAGDEDEAAPAPFVSRNDLPRDTPDFTGREDHLEELFAIGADGGGRAEVCVITGTGGAGKTTLAVHAAHRMAERYPDAQLFIDLHGHTVDQDPLLPATALSSLLRAVGVSPEAIPESLEDRAALWRATLADKRILVVLDNAVNYTQVSPLLSAASGSLTLVTSRHDLAGLGGARYISLGMLSHATAERFFSTVLGPERTKREPDALGRVVNLCGGLPLALRIVAGRMLTRPQWTFVHVEQRLSLQHRRFRELRTDAHSVEAVFELSYQSLNSVQQEVFLRLGLAIGNSIDFYGAAALTDSDLPRTDDLLQELVGVRLLEEQSVDLYRFHDLIGAYAKQKALRLLPEEEIDSTHRRISDYYLHAAQRAAEWLGPRRHDYAIELADTSRYKAEITTRSEAVEWFDRHRENLAAVVDHYAQKGSGQQAWQLADSLWRFYAVHGQTELWLTTHEQALAASRADSDHLGSAITLVGLGIAHCLSGRLDSSLSLLQEAKELFVSLGDQSGEMRAFANLGMVYERMGRYEDAEKVLSRALDHAMSIDDASLVALQRSNLGAIHHALGNYHEAIVHCEAALEIRLDGDSREIQASALRGLGEANMRLGKYNLALGQLENALKVFLAMEDSAGEIYTRNALGTVFREMGDFESALAAHGAALELGEKTAQRSAEAEVLNELGVTYARAGRYAEARSSLDEALRLARERHERYAEASALFGLSRLPAGAAPDDVAGMLATAAEIFTELGVPEAREAAAALEALGG